MNPRKNSKSARVSLPVIFAGVAVLAVGAGFFFLSAPARDHELICEIKPARFVETLEVPGEVDTGKCIDVRAPSAPYERQVTWLIPEGSSVKRGEVLAEFDTSDARSHLEENEDRVSYLYQVLETSTIDWDIDLTTESVRKDQKTETLDDARNRKEKSVFERPLRREIGAITFGVADLNLAQSTRRIHQLQYMSAYELRRRKGHIKYRQGRADRDEGFIAEYTVRSPADSVVIYPPIPLAGGIVRKAEPGDYLEREQAFLRLPDFSTRVLRLRVPEHSIEKIAPDAPLSFQASAYPGRKFSAHVISISNLAVSSLSRPHQKFFEVTAEIEPADGIEDLKPGMVVSALFTLRDHGEVCAIPRDLASKNAAGSYEIAIESRPGPLALPRGILETEDLLLVPAATFSPTGEGVRLLIHPGTKTGG